LSSDGSSFPWLAGLEHGVGKDDEAAQVGERLAAGVLDRHHVRLLGANIETIRKAEDRQAFKEMLEQIGDTGDGVLGTVVDTGWYGTQGCDSVRAIDCLHEHLVHVHLKDVLAEGEHVTCRYGRGIVPIEACVRKLQELGYAGGISVEHEPEFYDPTEDCRVMLGMVQGWLGAREGDAVSG